MGCGRHNDQEKESYCTRELCTLCGRFSPVGFWVPRSTWEAVAGHYQHNILCIMCFMLGDEKGIQWDQEIKFYPVSFVTHRAGN